MRVIVVDYGMCNLGSIRRSLEECGGDVCVSALPGSLADAERIVLPGVGAFADAMAALRQQGWVEPLRRCAGECGVPFLGICLGMQLLALHGSEGGDTEGLGLIPGRVVRLVQQLPEERIPHIGWNEVYPSRPSLLWQGIRVGIDFYFVHSYNFVPENPADILATTPYCGGFVSAVNRGQVFGTQFHPEKSQEPGLRLLRNFLGVGGNTPC